MNILRLFKCLTILIFILSCCSSNDLSDFKEKGKRKYSYIPRDLDVIENLQEVFYNGRVKSSRERHFNKINDGVVTINTDNRLILFDEKGNIIEESFFATNDSLWGKYVYRFDENNNEIEQLRYSSRLGDKPESRFIREYDSLGNKIFDYEYLSDGRFYKYELDYIGKNKLEELFYDLEGKLAHKINNEYNSGKLIKSTLIYPITNFCQTTTIAYNLKKREKTEVTTSNKGAFKKVVYKFDNKWNEIEKTQYDYSGAVVNKFVSEYDSNGNEVVWYQYDQGGLFVCKVIWVKDNSGYKRSHKRFNDKGILTSLEEYDYMGSAIRSYEYDERGEIKRETIDKYEYDNNGNWITRECFVNGESKEKWWREIEYYD